MSADVRATTRRLPAARRWRMAALAAALTLAGAMLLVADPGWLAAPRERALDPLVAAMPAPVPPVPVVVIDIGATDEDGHPWDRRAAARLAARIAAAGPRAVGWDVVFAGGCTPDGPNLALAAALSRAPSVLGFLLSAADAPLAGPVPQIALSGPATALWPAAGAEGPCAAFAGTATLGSVALLGDRGARVRQVPAAVAVAGRAWPSLPVEVVRRALALPLPVLAPSRDLRLGPLRVVLAPGGLIRFRPARPAEAAARTVSATDLLAGRADPARLEGAIVLVGSSLPQRGGLRPTAAGPLTPSVQIMADTVAGLAAGRLPQRAPYATRIEGAALAAGGVALAALVALLPPVPAFAGAAALAGLWLAGTVAAARLDGALYDPLFPPALLLGAALATLLTGAAAASRAERALRQRLRQQLPPSVVARLAADPGLFRLKGEVREITALITDLEGFTALTNRLGPEALIALLDRYFATVSPIVLRHGGMIDKFVGDGMLAFFNAPLDLPGHARAALACAAEIVAATEALRADPGLSVLGRTRIGVETGPAVLGDVGSAARIEYTALGAAVNMAARLQDAGKTLGPAVVVGPGTAAAVQGAGLRALGPLAVRGFGTVAVHTLAAADGAPDPDPRQEPPGPPGAG